MTRYEYNCLRQRSQENVESNADNASDAMTYDRYNNTPNKTTQ